MSDIVTASVPVIPASYQPAVEEAIRILANQGIRGASLRDIGKRSDTNFANVANYFGGKEKLIAICFSQVVKRDMAKLATFLADCRELQLSQEYVAAIAWDMCTCTDEESRSDILVLWELICAAEQVEAYRPILANWLSARSQFFRSFAEDMGCGEYFGDFLSLLILAEKLFYLSNADQLDYRLVASGGLACICGRLTGVRMIGSARSLSALVLRFQERCDVMGSECDHDTRHSKGRARIADAAADIIAELGQDAITNRAVAQRAEVSVALTSYHFQTVPDLEKVGLERLVERLFACWEHACTMDASCERQEGYGMHSGLACRGVVRVAMAAARSPAYAVMGRRIRRNMAAFSSKLCGNVGEKSGGEAIQWSGAVYKLTASVAASALADLHPPVNFIAVDAYLRRSLPEVV